MRARRIVVFLLAVTALPAAAPAPDGHAAARAPATTTVSMKRFEFTPARAEIPVGGRVRWTYDEDALDPQPNCESPYFQLPLLPVSCPGHGATSIARVKGKPLFDTGIHRADGFPKTLAVGVPGIFPYVCTVHGGETSNNPVTSMEGTLVVTPPTPGRLSDGNDVRGLLDLRRLTAVRTSGGGLAVTVVTWDTWATAALREGGSYRLLVSFDVDVDGAIGDADVVARLVYRGGRLVARLSGADGASTVPATRMFGTGVRFTLPASSSAAAADTDHQLAATSRTRVTDRVPAFPGWLPLPATS